LIVLVHGLKLETQTDSDPITEKIAYSNRIGEATSMLDGSLQTIQSMDDLFSELESMVG